MRDPRAAIEATIQLLRVQGKHPDQQVQGAGVRVSININTEWQGAENPRVVNTGDHAEATEPPESKGKPSRVVIIGRK